MLTAGPSRGNSGATTSSMRPRFLTTSGRLRPRPLCAFAGAYVARRLSSVEGSTGRRSAPPPRDVLRATTSRDLLLPRGAGDVRRHAREFVMVTEDGSPRLHVRMCPYGPLWSAVVRRERTGRPRFVDISAAGSRARPRLNSSDGPQDTIGWDRTEKPRSVAAGLGSELVSRVVRLGWLKRDPELNRFDPTPKPVSRLLVVDLAGMALPARTSARSGTFGSIGRGT